MAVLQLTQPALEPISLADAKAYLRIEIEAEDALISALIVAARSHVEAVTGTTMIHQTFRQYLDNWPTSEIALGRYPASQIVAVTGYDTEGEPADLIGHVAKLKTHERPALLTVDAVAREQVVNGLEIDFQAGYGPTSVDVPEPLRRAMLELVGHWYEFRSAIAPHQQAVSIPPTVETLLSPYRKPKL